MLIKDQALCLRHLHAPIAPEAHPLLGQRLMSLGLKRQAGALGGKGCGYHFS